MFYLLLYIILIYNIPLILFTPRIVYYYILYSIYNIGNTSCIVNYLEIYCYFLKYIGIYCIFVYIIVVNQHCVDLGYRKNTNYTIYPYIL